MRFRRPIPDLLRMLALLALWPLGAAPASAQTASEFSEQILISFDKLGTDRCTIRAMVTNHAPRAIERLEAIWYALGADGAELRSGRSPVEVAVSMVDIKPGETQTNAPPESRTPCDQIARLDLRLVRIFVEGRETCQTTACGDFFDVADGSALTFMDRIPRRRQPTRVALPAAGAPGLAYRTLAEVRAALAAAVAESRALATTLNESEQRAAEAVVQRMQGIMDAIPATQQ